MNFYIFLIAVVFWLTETAYFGWNFAPSCKEELICDGIAMIILALAFVGHD